jgi:glycosyltransferase involved in cell wall biosynthesis
LKILVVSAGYPSESNKHGFGFVHARAKLYRKYNHRVYVIVPSYNEKFKVCFQTYVYEGIRVFRIPINYIDEFIENIDPDVIAYHFPDPKVLAKLVSLERPLILWIHGADILITFFHNYYIPFYIKDLIRGSISISIDIKRNLQLRNLILKERNIQIVTPSIWMKKMIIRYLSLPSSQHTRIHVIPNPVDTNKFNPIKSCYERKRNMGISIRALDYKYGVDIAVKALCGLKDIELIVVGNGPLQNYLKSIAEKYKANIRFIYEGIPHEELPKYYNEAGFFVAPSRTEAQGVAMCEALACGTPAIATSVGGIPEFVIHGYNGILIGKPNPEELRKAIITLVKMPTENYCTLSQNAVKLAQRIYSSEVVIPRELCLFSKAIEIR